MKIKNACAIVGFFLAVGLFSACAPQAKAALVPYLSLTNTAGSSLVTATVTGADPNVSVMLDYPTASSYTSSNIGTTNASGYLLTTVDSSTYGITAGAPVYVIVDGQQSQQQAWPSYTSTGGLTLSQMNVSLTIGQSTVVTAPVSAALSLSTNTNPSVAGAVISGNQVTLIGNAFGSSNITICASGIGCGTVQVSVSSSGTTQTAVSFSQSSVVMSAGQSQQITITGSGSYYISSNSNSGVVSANVSGSTLYITGIAAGSSSLSICSTVSGGTTCGSVNVTVLASFLTTTNSNNTTSATLSFSQSDVTLAVGQSQAVSISGGTNASTVYYISNNSASNSVTANVSGASVNLYGIAFGGANITVCQSGGPWRN